MGLRHPKETYEANTARANGLGVVSSGLWVRVMRDLQRDERTGRVDEWVHVQRYGAVRVAEHLTAVR